MDSRFNSPSNSSHYSDSSSRSTSPNPLEVDASKRETLTSNAAAAAAPPLPPAIPALVMRQVIATELTETGFDAAHEVAIEFLEGALFNLFGSLLTYAHQLAELGRRHEPTVLDVIESCHELGIASGPGDLLQQARKRRQYPVSIEPIKYSRNRRNQKQVALLPSDDEAEAFSEPEQDPALASPPPSPARSVSNATDEDDDDDIFEEVVPLGTDGQPIPGAKEAKERKRRERDKERAGRETRRIERDRRRRAREFRKNEYGGTFRAEWAPTLPPKHSWKQTPVFPEQPPPPPIPDPVSRTAQAPSATALAHLSTLRARLNDSQLVASSLRNLIRRTGAAARGHTAYAPASASMTGLNDASDAAVTNAQVAAEQEADLVSYENGWYGSNKVIAASASQFKKGKRNVRIVKVGNEHVQDDEVNESDDERDRDDNFTKSGGGGVAKRRRWLV
ncbi:uncharacterized protein JCM15063_002570 [Sporobolomyces koalae]|uniref:uncharacterized protein n=1 Tax=Sporobolomyces koalae TaxID=500713 RepID=UPI00316FBFCD